MGLGFCVVLLFIGLCVYATQIIQNAEFDGGAIPSANTVLHLTLKGGLEEHPSDSPFDRFDINTMSIKENLGLDSLLVTLQKASCDARIDGLLIDLQGPSGQWAQKSELRTALQKFKEAGKWIVAYADTYSMEDYYIASLADHVYMGPRGDVELKGLGMEMVFLGRMLKTLGIDVEILKGEGNDYKSAVEPFSREQMSAENREQLEVLVKAFWTQIATTIENSRKLPPGKIDHYVESYLPNSPKSALECGLVDELLYRDQMMEKMIVKTGITGDLRPKIGLAEVSNLAIDGESEPTNEVTDSQDSSSAVNAQDKELKLMSVLSYAKGQKLFPLPNQDDAESGSVAVLLAQGSIVADEFASEDSITPEWMRSRLDKIRKDDKISALVLRLDSPGGDALASETIWKELDRFRQVKPLIVSMGPTVASGGYYMACAANVIVADPMTLTGSIGVFGLIPRMDKFLSQKLDITVDRVHSHPSIGGSGVLSPLSVGKRQDLQDEVDQVYDIFVRRVSTGRNLSTDKVRQIARGRIWSGKDAQKICLVDALGGLSDAIEIAKTMVGRNEKVIYYGSGELEEWLDMFKNEVVHLGKIKWMSQQFSTTTIQARCWVETL